MQTAASGRAQGFTLVECLACVALMALATSVLAVSLGSHGRRERMEAALRRVLEVDSGGRALARRGQPVVLRIDGGYATAEVVGADGAALRRDLPRSVDARALDPRTRAPMPVVRVGPDGRGPDYLVSVGGGGHHVEALVSGLSGYAFQSGVEADR